MEAFSLTRTVRLCVSPLIGAHSRTDAASVTTNVAANGLLGVPAPLGIAAIAEIAVTCVGAPAASGYLVDIGIIDRVIRAEATPRLSAALRAECETGVPTAMPALLAELARAVAPLLPAKLTRLSWSPMCGGAQSPFRSITVDLSPSNLTLSELPAMPHQLLLTETFEFAASHRLHLSDRSDADNQALFGKCNNPNGHGHNYRIEVAVAMNHATNANDRQSHDFTTIQRVVHQEIVTRFDHRHLNLDCPEFATRNPSVENIAVVCYELLAPRFASIDSRLEFVRVWETDKTSCRYPA